MSQARTKTQQNWTKGKFKDLINESPPTLRRFTTKTFNEGRTNEKIDDGALTQEPCRPTQPSHLDPASVPERATTTGRSSKRICQAPVKSNVATRTSVSLAITNYKHKTPGTPKNNIDVDGQGQTCNTPTKAALITLFDGLPSDITGSRAVIHPSPAPTPTASPLPLQGISHIRILDPLDTAIEQKMAADMANSTLQPEPGNQLWSEFLPTPCESDTEIEQPSTPSKMNIDDTDTPPKATFSTKNYGLQGEDTEVRSGQHIEHNQLSTQTTTPSPLQLHSLVQTPESMERAIEQSMVVDMTDPGPQPEPTRPDNSIFLPMPCDSESDQEGPSTPSKMNID